MQGPYHRIRSRCTGLVFIIRIFCLFVVWYETKMFCGNISLIASISDYWFSFIHRILFLVRLFVTSLISCYPAITGTGYLKKQAVSLWFDCSLPWQWFTKETGAWSFPHVILHLSHKSARLIFVPDPIGSFIILCYSEFQSDSYRLFKRVVSRRVCWRA